VSHLSELCTAEGFGISRKIVIILSRSTGRAMMVRVPPRGSTLATLPRKKQELGGCLVALGVSIDRAGGAEIYEVLCSIAGRWWVEKSRLETASVAEALISLSRQLDKIGTTLNAHATGLHQAVDIEIVCQLTSVSPLIQASDRSLRRRI
jgi:hypothetical protein